MFKLEYLHIVDFVLGFTLVFIYPYGLYNASWHLKIKPFFNIREKTERYFSELLKRSKNLIVDALLSFHWMLFPFCHTSKSIPRHGETFNILNDIFLKALDTTFISSIIVYECLKTICNLSRYKKIVAIMCSKQFRSSKVQ